MPNPKRKHSKARTRRRRTHDKLKSPNLVRCVQCNQLHLPHRVCGNCGHYGKEEVVKL